MLCTLLAVQPVRADVISSPAPLTETRVLAGDKSICKTNPPGEWAESAIALAIPLATAAAGKLVEVGAQEFSDYLTRTIANDSTAVTLNVVSTYFYQLKKNIKHQWTVGPELECITIVRGRFGKLDRPAHWRSPRRSWTPGIDSPDWTSIARCSFRFWKISV